MREGSKERRVSKYVNVTAADRIAGYCNHRLSISTSLQAREGRNFKLKSSGPRQNRSKETMTMVDEDYRTMQKPSPLYWYRLTNAFTTPSFALDVVNDGGKASSGTLEMAPSGNFSGQYWRLVPNPDPSSTTYALYTLFLGANKRLDVYGDDKTKPHLADAGRYSGQIWTLKPWGDGTWQLTNQYSGPDLHLDVYSDTKVPFMGDGNHTGQHWTLTAIARVDAGSTAETGPREMTRR
jgi:hypothetical protein